MPVTNAPAAAPATVLTKSLRLGTARLQKDVVASDPCSPKSYRGLTPHLKITYDVIRNSFIRLPPRIASLSALLRYDALRIRSTFAGQLNGMSVP